MKAAISDVNSACIATISPWLVKLLANVKTLADGGDLKANAYLLDRLLGKPTERKELSGQLGIDAPLSEAFELALAKVYAHVAPILALECESDAD